ncbi:MAG: enolase C-terminal domain-like protein [Chloroflexota bacterium]
MKISEVVAFYPRYPQTLAGWRQGLWQIVVRIESDSGLVGWGYGGGGEASLPIVNGHFRSLLLGQEIHSTGELFNLWDQLYKASIPYGRKGIAMMALSGIDLALWDLLGKAEEKPVYEMLGGLRSPDIHTYATGTDTTWYAELGYSAHKMPHRWDPAQPAEAQFRQTEEQLAAARTLFGSEGLLMLDCYMTWDAAVTREMAQRLQPYDLFWFEDVAMPDQLEEQNMLRDLIKPISLAGGEHEFTHYGFSALAQNSALDIWQPDITWCGGMTALLRIMELARQFEIPVVLHRGGEVWGLHAIASGGCASLAEVLPGTRDDDYPTLWIDEPQPMHGRILPTDLPGFGVSPNPELI